MSTEVHECRLRVRYAETDAMGIAHHSAYLPWLEVGRVEWMRAQGLSYAQFERDGYALPLVEVHIRYVTASRFDDPLVIRTALWDARSRGVRFSYEIVTDEEHPRQVANATTRHVCLSNGGITRLPAELREAIGEVRDGQRLDQSEQD